MFAILVTALLMAIPSFAIKSEFDGNSNVCDPVMKSRQALEALQMAERMGINLSATTNEKVDRVCYDELGCFDKNGTFKHLKLLPESPDKVKTKFLLYTKKNPDTPQFLDYQDPETIVNSNINPKLPILYLTHGFSENVDLNWMKELRDALIKMEDVNVIIIDYSIAARLPYYVTATVNSELVGAQAAALFYVIKEKLGSSEKDLHLIGYSLGAHVVGFMAKRMKMLRGTKPGRITGLDPASPLFEGYGGDVHLFRDDADFVDVIHTNADGFISGGVGMEVPIGHVDHFPNGGKRQPGCKSTIKGALLDIFKGEKERTCNHERAVHLFTDSILHPDSCQYVGYPCSNYSDYQMGKCLSCDATSCGHMGYRATGSGIYYLLTKPEKPYCVETGKLTVRYPSTVKKSYGLLILTLTGENGDKENITLSQKDEKLSPGGGKELALPVNDVLKPLSKVQILYVRYNGWFTKGSKTFGLDLLTISDSKGNYVFKTCGQEIVLKDNEYQELKPTEANC